MAVIDADAHVVETERTWASIGFFAHPPHAAHSMGALGKEPQEGQDSYSCLKARVIAIGCQC